MISTHHLIQQLQIGIFFMNYLFFGNDSEISGAYILIILGTYEFLIKKISDFSRKNQLQ